MQSLLSSGGSPLYPALLPRAEPTGPAGEGWPALTVDTTAEPAAVAATNLSVEIRNKSIFDVESLTPPMSARLSPSNR